MNLVWGGCLSEVQRTVSVELPQQLAGSGLWVSGRRSEKGLGVSRSTKVLKDPGAQVIQLAACAGARRQGGKEGGREGGREGERSGGRERENEKQSKQRSSGSSLVLRQPLRCARLSQQTLRGDADFGGCGSQQGWHAAAYECGLRAYQQGNRYHRHRARRISSEPRRASARWPLSLCWPPLWSATSATSSSRRARPAHTRTRRHAQSSKLVSREATGACRKALGYAGGPKA